MAPAHRQHHDLRTDVSPVIKIDHILVEQADAARGHEAADGLGRVGAVNAIDGVAKIHRARAEGIARAARHEARQIGLALDHLRGRRPVRPLGLALDRLHAGPSEAFTTHANAVPHRLAAGEYQVKVRVRRVDDDSAGRLAGTVIDNLAAQLATRLVRVILRVGVGRRGHRLALGAEQRLEWIERIRGSRRGGARHNESRDRGDGLQAGKTVHGHVPL